MVWVSDSNQGPYVKKGQDLPILGKPDTLQIKAYDYNCEDRDSCRINPGYFYWITENAGDKHSIIQESQLLLEYQLLPQHYHTLCPSHVRPNCKPLRLLLKLGLNLRAVGALSAAYTP